MKDWFKAQLKNLAGTRFPDKYVVLSFDDYGNVRTDSRKALDTIRTSSAASLDQFDEFDAVETVGDLEALYGVLTSVKDSEGRPAVVTTYTNSANPDFEQIRKHLDGFYPEPIEKTFERLAAEQPQAYDGAWNLLFEGIGHGLISPQFHGREHLNLAVFNALLDQRDPSLMACLATRSICGLSPGSEFEGVNFTASYAVVDGSETEEHREIISDGLGLFRRAFGFASITFTPPAGQISPKQYPFLESLGILAIDKSQRCIRRISADRTVREVNILGPSRRHRHLNLVRNVVFEPGKRMFSDPVGHALLQIEAAFRWKKPAIISSHRVNFGGHIDPRNRDRGLSALRDLLKNLTRRWPDVKFISADQLTRKMQEGQA